MTAAMADDVVVAGSLEASFRRHHAALLRLAVVLTGDRALADDLVQDAFLRLHRARSRPHAGAELAYLRRTVINLSHGHHRHLAVVRRREPAVRVDAEPGADVEAADRDRRRAVADAIRRLPARQRDCVVLHYFAGLSDAEIAADLGIGAGSVKTHLHRARATLAEHLEQLR